MIDTIFNNEWIIKYEIKKKKLIWNFSDNPFYYGWGEINFFQDEYCPIKIIENYNNTYLLIMCQHFIILNSNSRKIYENEKVYPFDLSNYYISYRPKETIPDPIFKNIFSIRHI